MYIFIFVLFVIENPVSIMWRLIWDCTVCLCPTKGTSGLFGLKSLLASQNNEGTVISALLYRYMYALESASLPRSLDTV